MLMRLILASLISLAVPAFTLNVSKSGLRKIISNLKTASVAAFTFAGAFQGPIHTSKLHSITEIFRADKADAAIAPLADVGLHEFLVKDGRQWLRIGLPAGPDLKIGEKALGDPIKLAQEDLELVRLRLEQVGFSNKAVWGGALKDANDAEALIKKNQESLLKGSTSEAKDIYENELLPAIKDLQGALRDQNFPETSVTQEKAAALLGKLRQLQYPVNKLPYQIPAEYASLPRLNGRATVEFIVASSGKGYRLSDEKTVIPNAKFTIEIDGYHAPITGGNFVDLVNKKFYDGMLLQRVEELTVQTGLPSSGSEGFVDPKTRMLRTIPLEVFYKKDAEPVYSITSDDDMRSTDAIALPFQAYGAVGMARSNDDVDSGSSQFFLLKWNQALNPPGRNTLDGFYTCFGYVTENEDLLKQVTPKDKIISAKVVSGLPNLVVP